MGRVTELVLLLGVLQKVGGSVFSGAEGICSLQECACSQDTVVCRCSTDSSFQESFMFIDDSRKLRHLVVENCPKLVLPAQALSRESRLVRLDIQNVSSVEFHADSLVISVLRELVVRGAESVTFRQHSLVSGITNSPLVNITVSSVGQLTVEDRSFSSLNSFMAEDIDELNLRQHAFKLKVPTEVPTITISLVNISTASLSSSVFPSSFKSILVKNSKVDTIHTNAFSGLNIKHIKFEGVSIQRIERNAFSDSAAISLLEFIKCNISSMSQKSVVAGVSKFILTDSEIQSVSKHGAINATVATVVVTNNRFKTLGQESFQFVAWDSVIISNNTFDFIEQGAINAIKSPTEDLAASFTFTNNLIGSANVKSLVTQIPADVSVVVFGNKLGHRCDCELGTYVRSITGQSSLSSPFRDLTPMIKNTSLCKLSPRERGCFRANFIPINDYLSHQLCDKGQPEPPACAREKEEEKEEEAEVSIVPIGDVALVPGGNGTSQFHRLYEEFVLLFQVKTTKGILLFLLFCVLSSVITLTICVGSIWVHRLCRRAKLVRDNLSGSFQFNSGEDKQILYGSDQTTCHSLPGESGEEEPTYAEIADIHPPPKDIESQSPMLGAHWTTLPVRFPSTTIESSATASTTLPSMEANTLPLRTADMEQGNTECTSLLSDSEVGGLGGLETTQVSRLSMSETSLTDEIMMALRDKLSDPNLYMSVLDAKSPTNHSTSTTKKPVRLDDDLYCSPLYCDPLQLSPAK